MKKLLVLTIVLALLVALPYSSGAQDKHSFVYVAYDYSGAPGISYGLGFTSGKISIVPTTRYAIGERFSTGGIQYDKTLGVEIIYWLYEGTSLKFGLMAAPVDVDWLEFQNKETVAYISQAGGASFVFSFSDKLSVFGAVKGTDQLFNSGTLFKERIRWGLGFLAEL